MDRTPCSLIHSGAQAKGVVALNKIAGSWLRKECSSTDVAQVTSIHNLRIFKGTQPS